jgi:hypothetical protein
LKFDPIKAKEDTLHQLQKLEEERVRGTKAATESMA